MPLSHDILRQCTHHFIKNGTTSSGTVRWRCTRCGTSKSARRPRSKVNHQLAFFRDYLTHYDTRQRVAERHESGGRSRSTLYRRSRPFLDTVPPPLSIPHSDTPSRAAIMLDGFYIAYPSIKEHRHLPGAKTATSILLLAIDAYTHEPLHWHIYQRFEDVRAWNMFFAELVKLGFSPKYLVHDGHSGIQRASAIYLPEARHQRCLVHMVRGAHRKLGITPKSPLARQLQSLIHHLVTVRTHAGKAVWLAAWGDYLAAFEYAESTNTPQTNALRGLKAILMHAYERDELFTFLDEPGLPHTSNAIESRNRVLREALRRHRGMTLSQREAMVSWLLLLQQTDDLTVIRKHYETTRNGATLCDT